MNRVLYGIQVLALLWLPVTVQAQDKPASPAAQYQKLLTEFKQAASPGRVLTDEERMVFVGKAFRKRRSVSLKLVELAEKYPQDPVAEDALLEAIWHVNTRPWPVKLVGEDKARNRALALLERDHIQSEKLGVACQRLSFGFCKEYETFLLVVLKKSPHRKVQAQACLALAHYLNIRLLKLDLIAEQPKRAQEFAGLYGKEFLERLQRQDRTKATSRVEEYFELAGKKYGDVELPRVGLVGERAKAELFSIRHLLVGKEAPEIEGQDQDGIEFKLSDYRGKVVLLDFWSQY